MKIKVRKEIGGFGLGISWDSDYKELYILFILWAITCNFSKGINNDS